MIARLRRIPWTKELDPWTQQLTRPLQCDRRDSPVVRCGHPAGWSFATTTGTVRVYCRAHLCAALTQDGPDGYDRTLRWVVSNRLCLDCGIDGSSLRRCEHVRFAPSPVTRLCRTRKVVHLQHPDVTDRPFPACQNPSRGLPRPGRHSSSVATRTTCQRCIRREARGIANPENLTARLDRLIMYCQHLGGLE